MVRVTNDTTTNIQLHTSARVIIANLAQQGNTADCDSDGSVEPFVWRDPTGGATAPTGGGLIPLTSIAGAPITDVWNNEFGYCVWDVGSAIDDASCGGSGQDRLSGSPAPTAGDYVSQTTMALISAGPDQEFSTQCSDYTNGTTDVITMGAGSDDIVFRYSHEDVFGIGTGLWSFSDATNTLANNIPTGCPTIGDVCSDGTIYAGITPDGNVDIYAIPCDIGMSFNGTTCTGNRAALPWGDGTTDYSTTGEISRNRGAENTQDLVLEDSNANEAGSGAGPLTQPHIAADSCGNLEFAGHRNWHLPATNELNILYTNRNTIGNFQTSASGNAHRYWAATEVSFSNAEAIRFDNGSIESISKDTQLSVRCIRRVPPANEGDGCPNIGDLCNDGTVYAGVTPDNGIDIYTTPCSRGKTFDGASCLGTFAGNDWNGSSSSTDFVETGATSTFDGDTNSRIVIGTDSDSVLGGKAQEHDSFDDCNQLGFANHLDWYLPAQDELLAMLPNAAAIGDFDTNPYWSSTEASESQVVSVNMSTGQVQTLLKNTEQNIRCIRQRSRAGGVSNSDTATIDRGIDVIGAARFTAVNASGRISSRRGIRLPDETVATICGGSDIGLLRFNVSTSTIEVCDGTNFNAVTFSGTSAGGATPPFPECPNIGDLCNDGTLYMGISPDNGSPFFTTPCRIGLVLNGNGTGCMQTGGPETRLFPWNNDNDTSSSPATNATSLYDGVRNTSTIISIDSDTTTPGIQPHQAAQLCADLNANGYDDWYLPAQDEMRLLIDNVALLIDTNADFLWSSTEASATSAVRGNGTNTNNISKNLTGNVRCVRQMPNTPDEIDRLTFDVLGPPPSTTPSFPLSNDPLTVQLECNTANAGRIRMPVTEGADFTPFFSPQYCNGVSWVGLQIPFSNGDSITFDPDVLRLHVNQPGDPEAFSAFEDVLVINTGTNDFTYLGASHASLLNDPDFGFNHEAINQYFEVDDSDCHNVTLTPGQQCRLRIRARLTEPGHFSVQYFAIDSIPTSGFATVDIAAGLVLIANADPLDVCAPGAAGPGGHYAACTENKILISNKGQCDRDLTDPSCDPSTRSNYAQYLTFDDTASQAWSQYTGYDPLVQSTSGRTGSEFLFNATSDNLTFPAIYACLYLNRGGYEDYFLPSVGERNLARFANEASILNNQGLLDGFTVTESGTTGNETETILSVDSLNDVFKRNQDEATVCLREIAPFF